MKFEIILTDKYTFRKLNMFSAYPICGKYTAYHMSDYDTHNVYDLINKPLVYERKGVNDNYDDWIAAGAVSQPREVLAEKAVSQLTSRRDRDADQLDHESGPESESDSEPEQLPIYQSIAVLARLRVVNTDEGKLYLNDIKKLASTKLQIKKLIPRIKLDCEALWAFLRGAYPDLQFETDEQRLNYLCHILALGAAFNQSVQSTPDLALFIANSNLYQNIWDLLQEYTA